MKSMKQLYSLVLSAAVLITFALIWVIVVVTNDPPEYQFHYVASAGVVGVIAVLWVIAVRLLWHALWIRISVGLTIIDSPALLLAIATGILPDNRKDWGKAMVAELDYIRDYSSRWQFAVGCVWTAINPPRSNRVSVLGILVLIVTVTLVIGEMVNYTLPAMRIFAVSFIMFVSIIALLILSRSRFVFNDMPGSIIATLGVTGVTACIALISYFMIKHPSSSKHFSPSVAIPLALFMACVLWLVLKAPRGLTMNQAACRFGVGSALTLGLGFLLVARITINTNAGPMIWIIFAPIIIFFIASVVTAMTQQSFRAGVQTAIWTALLGTLLILVIGLYEGMYRYGIDARLLLDGEIGYPIGKNLEGVIMIMISIPVLGLPIGVIGAGVGIARHQNF